MSGGEPKLWWAHGRQRPDPARVAAGEPTGERTERPTESTGEPSEDTGTGTGTGEIPSAVSSVPNTVRAIAQTQDGPSDGALLASMALGDELAGIAFVRRYQRRVFGLALSMVRDPGLAEDIAQEALVRVWKHAPVYDDRRGGVSTWVFSITRNLAIDALRVRRAVPTNPEEILALTLSNIASREGDPEASALVSDDTARVRAALTTVPEAQRRALILAAFYGRTAAEVSEIESIPLGTAKTRIRGGLLKMRAAMATAEAEA